MEIQKAECPCSEAGFSLLETLVAVMVLGVSLVVILQLFSGALRAGSLSANYTRALFIAQNKMEETLVKPLIEEGETEGNVEEIFSYIVTLTWIEPEESEKKAAFDLFDISVRVAWQEGGSVKEIELNTITLSEAKRSVNVPTEKIGDSTG